MPGPGNVGRPEDASLSPYDITADPGITTGIDFAETVSDIFFSFKQYNKGQALLPMPATDLPDIPAYEPPSGGDGKSRFLLYAGAALVGLTAAPALYSLYKGRKRGKKGQTGSDPTLDALEASSARITQVIASAAPVLAFPAAYIGVQELENRGIISGGLGDSVQTLMATLAGGSAISGVSSIFKALI